MDIQFTDNSDQIKAEFKQACQKALEKCGLTAEGYAKQACPVDTGALRNSISHTVKDTTCYVGSNQEYAAYVELGTGVYYVGGRKTPWVYQDGKGNWHRTSGQKAQAYLKPAVADHGDTYRSLIDSTMRNG